MEGVNLTVTVSDGGVMIDGVPPQPEDTKWRAEVLDQARILLRADDMHKSDPSDQRVLASCPVNVLKDILIGFTTAGFSGVVAVDNGYGIKRLFFNNGAVVFASSNIIDDRLGAVMFREGRINIDDLTNSAAQVTKTKKFGQATVSTEALNNVALWQALKLQVRQIIRSVFMQEQVFFEAIASKPTPPTEVVFEEPPADLLRAAYSYGCVFRNFLGRLRAETQVVLLIPPEEATEINPLGTFVGDLVNLISTEPSVQELLNNSKLIDPYTIAALLNLVNQGLCKIVPELEEPRKFPPNLAALKAKFDSYAYVLQAVRRAFADEGKAFPIKDVRVCIGALNSEGFPMIYVDEQAALARDCISGIIIQCSDDTERMRYFLVRIESLIQFLLQIATDNLDSKAAVKIRQDYRAVT